MEELLKYQEVQIALGVIILLIILFFVIRWLCGRSMRRKVYLCIEDFMRNCHEQDFYAPCRKMDEHVPLYKKLNGRRKAWYYNKYNRDFLEHFMDWFDVADDFTRRMANYMSAYHYFAHSEYLSCIDGIDLLKDLFPLLDDDFIYYVQAKVPSSLSTVQLYKYEVSRDLSDIPQTHNTKFVKEELERQKTYFDTMLKFPLSQQQRESIVKMEDNCLVVSSAGSGKTATSIAKIKYLVEKRGLEPSKILAITYTRKAAEELRKRLESLKITGVECHTFHGKAFDIVQNVTGKTPDICEMNLMLQCFYKLIEDRPDFKKSVNTFLTTNSSLTKNDHDYTSAKEYYKDRAMYGIQAPFKDMDGRIIFTKSEEEKKICTFLSMNNISFRYEQPFPYVTADNDHRQYKPDFTIYFELNGRTVYVILEHFGIDAAGNVPIWFGEGQSGGYAGANQRYHEGIDWKRSFNRQHRRPLLETTSAMFQDGTIYENLTRQLQQYNIPMRPLTEEELFERLVRRNRKMEDALLQLITTFITLMKSNQSSCDEIMETIKRENVRFPEFIERSRFMLDEILQPMFDEYQKTLKERNQVDFSDLIIQATDFCETGRWTSNYHTILVDEFQDISVDRFKFLQSLRQKSPLTKLYSVGDDWQSIFRFSGSDLTLFNEFENYFGYTEKCKMEDTYRFGQPMIKLSSNFILKNSSQIHKELRSNDENKKTTISLHEYKNENNEQLACVQSIVSQIDPSESIMLLGRYNNDADFIPRNCVSDLKDNWKIVKVRIAGREIPFHTVHSAKGLEADHIILVNCSQGGYGFPSTISDDPILGYLLSKPEEFPYAEERRLFYVAITRAKKQSYILYDKNCPSPFVNELLSELKPQVTAQNMPCPMCQNGYLRVLSEGETPYYRWRFYGCSNRTARCRYTWLTRFNDERNLVHEFNDMVQRARRDVTQRAVVAVAAPDIPSLPIEHQDRRDTNWELPF
jgi:DNA helicase-4